MPSRLGVLAVAALAGWSVSTALQPQPKTAPSDVQQAGATTSPAAKPASRARRVATSNASSRPEPRSGDDAARAARPPRRWSPIAALAARLKTTRRITGARAARIDRVLEDLRVAGAAAVPSIGEFLRHGDDVDFAKFDAAEMAGHGSLRLALIGTLFDIGGSEAIAVALEQLQQTKRPAEIAMLARGVEAEEPGTHVARVMEAVDEALQSADLANARGTEAPDVSPLFDVLRNVGGEHAVAVLQRSVPRWGEYALIALAGLRDGAGLGTLLALANTDEAPVANRALPFQLLAQTTLDYPEAGDELVDLTRAGRIPDDVWKPMSEALSGKQLHFARTDRSTAPSPQRRSYYIEWMNVRYEQDVVSTEWSADQIARQQALIDELLDATSSPAAVQALELARASLRL
jgi:hypothetical protein